MTTNAPARVVETLSLTRVAAALATVAAAGAVAYAVYFDHRRRTDKEFRRSLNAQRRQARSLAAQRDTAARNAAAYAAQARNAGMGAGGFELEDEPIPTTPHEREAYFSKYLAMGESLMARGPAGFETAATCFFRALKVYPDPMNLLMILQQSLPEPILNSIVELMAADVRNAQGGASSPQPVPSSTVEEIE